MHILSSNKNETSNFLFVNIISFTLNSGIPCSSHTDFEDGKYHPSIGPNGECQGMNNIGLIACDVNSPHGTKRICDCIPEGIT